MFLQRSLWSHEDCERAHDTEQPNNIFGISTWRLRTLKNLRRSLTNCPWKLIFQWDNRSSAPIRTVGAAHSSLVAASCSALIKNSVGFSFLPSSLKDFTVIPLVLLLFLSATCSGNRSSISCVLLSCRHSWSTRLPLSSSVYRSLSIISVDARTALIIFTVTVYRSRCGRPFRLCLMFLWLNDKTCVSACY